MTYRFIKQWRCYTIGRVIDTDESDLNRGQIELLVSRRILVPHADTVAVGTRTTEFTAMDAQPATVMVKRRGRPLGSKNRPKEG